MPCQQIDVPVVGAGVEAKNDATVAPRAVHQVQIARHVAGVRRGAAGRHRQKSDMVLNIAPLREPHYGGEIYPMAIHC